ncbi:MAG: hypothetical protein H6Q76_260, partial [Firmicutes bacterium]|nr:hypothetical protein [Bacillota bacterium]
CIQSALIANCRTTDRGVKANDDWTVLEETACPAVLVELAFISNDKDREMLVDKFLQRQCAVGIANGIEQYSNSKALIQGFGNNCFHKSTDNATISMILPQVY